MIKLQNSTYTVPEGKTLYIASATNFQDPKDPNKSQIVFRMGCSIVVPEGLSITTTGFSGRVSGILVNKSSIIGIFHNLAMSNYTVPSGKTFYLTYFKG